MKALKLSKERSARVWIDENPPIGTSVNNSRVSHRAIKIQEVRPLKHKIVTIELLVPLGGRFLYGLLGCEVMGERTSPLDVVVETSVEVKSEFFESLAGNIDTVWSGISDEYTDAILDGASMGASKFGVPPVGQIKFCFGAYGEIGSTGSIFERLGMAAMALLTSSDNMSIEEVLEHAISN